MRRGLGVVVASLCVSMAISLPAMRASVAHGDDTTTTESTTESTGESTTTTTTTTTTTMLDPDAVDADALNGATRGTAAQVTPTAPPPITAAPHTPWIAPENSGSDRRVVYSKGSQRVWLINSSNTVERSYLVSGRLDQPKYGTYSVFSRSTYTCSITHQNICMRWMVRFTKGPSGDNIGFHEIPRKDGVPMQSDSQLGTPLSSGCVRQSTADAMVMWGWAGLGTKVVVIP